MKITRFIAPTPVSKDPFEVDDACEAEVMRNFDEMSNDDEVLDEIIFSVKAEKVALKLAKAILNRENVVGVAKEYRLFMEGMLMDRATEYVDSLEEVDVEL